VALANLQTKLTTSSQTAASAFRRESETQYWPQKTSDSQTMAHKGQSMIKHMRYITGLRGDPTTIRMKVVNLELDLGQPHGF
jgi:hypothetical protein